MTESIPATTPETGADPKAKAEPGASRPPLVKRPGFALVELGCALAAAALWYLSDGRLGPWPLLLAAVPWAARAASGRFPLPRTRFDLPLLLFMGSAAVAAWVSPVPELAWSKFWLLVGATILFYALAAQRSPTIWTVVRGLGIAGAVVALYFLLTHDFAALPAKIAPINHLGLSLQRLRPDFLGTLHVLHPNVAGGLMALLFPFAIASAIRGYQRHHTSWVLIGSLAAALSLLGLLFTTSRGAWLALAGGLMAWGLWAASGRIHKLVFLSRRQTLALALVLVAALLASLVLLQPGGLVGLANQLPGPASAGSRLEISRDAIDLAGDFSFTGGGLSSFDGLYSLYIRVIPHHYLIHGHSLFLDTAVEQGFIGLMLLLVPMGLAYWWLSDPGASGLRQRAHGTTLLCGATLAALTVICLHGLVEDPLYGSRGALLLWLPLGLTAFLFPVANRPPSRGTVRDGLIIAAAAGIAVVGLVLLYRGPMLASWEANRGALAMAQVQLEGYPQNRWSDGSEAARLADARARFERALVLDDGNRTAWHRLGQIALLERDFETAQDTLTRAYVLDPNHRGITKSLAYAALWNNDVHQALPLLATLPETPAELGAYETWWQDQGRDDLSLLAAEARSALPTPEKP